MFGQFLPNKNEMLQCSTVLHSDSSAANSGQLNTPLIQISLFLGPLLFLFALFLAAALNVD
jgi:hypothetical protein